MSENRPTAPLGPPDRGDETPRERVLSERREGPRVEGPQVQRLQRLDEPVSSEGADGAGVERPVPEADKRTVELPVPLVPAPPPEDGPAIPAMTPEALAETLSKSSAELGLSASGERRPFAVPPTRVYDTSITKRLENDPELGRPVREPVLETPARPLPRPVPSRPTMRDRIRHTTVRVIERVPNRYRPDLAKLRRRTIYALLLLLAVRLVVALVLNFALDLVCRELLGLSVDVGHSHLRLASGEVVFEDLALSTPGGQPIARVGRAELEISWSALPTIWIHRAVLEDATITLRREVDGSMPALAELLDLIQKEIAKPPKPNKTPPRVVLDAVRVNHGRVTWEDVSTVPPLRETLELEARADDLALDGRRLENPTRVSVRLQAPGLLDALRLDAAARPEGDARALDLDFALEGHPRILSAYLAPHVVPIARSVSLEAKARLVTRPCLLEGQEGQTADLAVERLAYKADDDEVGCDRLLVSARRIARDALEVSSVVVDRPRAALAKLRGGGVRFGGFEFPSHEDAPEEKRAPSKPFELPFMLVDEVAVHAGSFHFTDETTAPTVSILAKELEASLRDVVKDPRRPQAKARLEVSVAVDDLARRIQVAGTVAPFGEPRTASLTAGARGISLVALEPWLAQAGLGTALSEGTLSLGVEASLAEKNGRYVLDATASRVTLDATPGDRRAAIDAVKVQSAELDPDTGTLAVGSIEVTGPQARLVRSKDGVAFVGLRTRPRVPSLVSESERRTRKTPLIRRVSVDKVLVSDVKASWRDDTAATPVELGLANGRLSATGISFVVSSTETPHGGTPGAHPPANGADPPACLTASFDLTPAIGTVRLDAALVANPVAPSVSGTLACSHVSLAPLAPYLARAGMEPALEDGLVTARVQASAATDGLKLENATLVLEGLALVAKEGELAAIDRLALAGAAAVPPEQRFELGSVAIEGVRARVARTAKDAVEAFGLRFLPGGGEAAPDNAPAPLPLVRWGEVDLKGAELTWVDQTVEPRVTLHLRRLDASLGARHLDHEALSGPPPVESPAPFKLHAEVDGLLDSLDLVGGLVPSLRAPVLFANVHARGASLAALEPYLETAGLEAALEAGELDGRVEASALVNPSSVRARATIRDLTFKDRRGELASLARGTVALDLEKKDRTLTFSSAEADSPRLSLRRSRQGALHLLGMAVVEDSSTRRPPSPTVPPPRVGRENALRVRLDGAHVTDLAVRYSDEGRQAMLDLERGRLDLDPVELSGPTQGSRFLLHAEVAGVGSLDADGAVKLDALAPSISATVALRHLHGAPLGPFLAGRGSLLLRDGSLDTRLALSRRPNPEGGVSLDGLLLDLEVREGERRLLAAAAVHASAPRVDGNVLEVDDLLLAGVRGEVELLPEGRLRIGAFELAPRPAPAPSANVPEANPDEEGPPLAPLPSLKIARATIACDRVQILDHTSSSDAPPFVVTDAELLLPEAFELSNENPGAALLSVAGSLALEGVARRATLLGYVLPFESEPHGAVQVTVEGISGPGLIARAPELAARMDPSAVTNGTFQASVTFDLKNRRRLDGLLANLRAVPIEIEASLADVTFKGTPDGPELLGLDELHVDAAALNLATGETRLRSVELANPRVRLRREVGGVRFLDTVWKSSPHPDPAPAARGEGEKAARPEVRIDRIALTDGDLLLEDGTVKPEASLQLGALEVELTGFTTRALAEKRQLRLRVAARGSTFFEELAGRGSFALFPEVDGDLDASLVGLKLVRVAGYTKNAWKLDLKDGRLDLDARARFRNGRLSLPMHFLLAEAQVDEPTEGSLISQKAGISVGTALGLLKRDDETVPFDQTYETMFDGLVPRDSFDLPGILGNAIGAALKGLGSKPVAAAESVGKSVMGAFTGRGDEGPKSVHVPFLAGDARLPAGASKDLDVLAARLRSDSSLRVTLRAEVGAKDEERSRKLAAPTREERHDLIARLEARRDRLEARRSDADALVRAALLSGSPDEIGAARAKHARAARAVQETDRSLDALYDQERDARGKSGEKRMREVAMDLCDARVEALRGYLVRQGVSVEQIKALRARTKAAAEGDGTGRVSAQLETAPSK